MITAFERRAMQLEESFGIDFTWGRSRAYTVGYGTYSKLLDQYGKQTQEVRPKDAMYLIFDSFCEIEEYDRITEVAAVTRPNILVMLSIICFVTGKPLTTFGFSSIHAMAADPNQRLPANKPRLEVEGGDYSKSLVELLKAMRRLPQAKQTLIFSLLDRWRKASYLKEENEESFLYEDEIILACFHILELLGDEYSSMIDTDMDQKLQSFTRDTLQNIFFIQSNKIHADLTKVIRTTLNAYKTVKPKILRLMKELDLLQAKSKALIDRFLGYRNAIAHGRANLYEDKAIYPLKPFFPHMKDIYEDIDTIRITSARAIAAYLGTSLWEDEWNEVIEEELPPYEQVQVFNRQRAYEHMSWQQMEEGDANGIDVGVLIHYYRTDALKQIPFAKMLVKYIQEVKLQESNAILVLYVAAILADFEDASVAFKARELLVTLEGSELNVRFKMRDIVKELAYQGKEPQWLKSFLSERASTIGP